MNRVFIKDLDLKAEYEKFMSEDIKHDMGELRLYEDQFVRNLSNEELKIKEKIEERNDPKAKAYLDKRTWGYEKTVDLAIELNNNKYGKASKEIEEKNHILAGRVGTVIRICFTLGVLGS